jgi:hypothetical protein
MILACPKSIEQMLSKPSSLSLEINTEIEGIGLIKSESVLNSALRPMI